MRQMTKLTVVLLAGLLLMTLVGGCAREEGETQITVFCGSASKPAMEDAAIAFEEKTGIKVYLNFGGSGTMLSQMILSKSGDVYIPGSPDYMVKAERDGVIEPKTTKIISYLIPAILVQHGNPRNIENLSDLARPGIKVGIGNPDAVCVGLYAVEVLDFNNHLDDIQENIITYAESCSKTASLVVLKSVDSVIGWRVFSEWHPDAIDVVYLEPEQLPRLAYIPAAVSTFANDRENAARFIDFLVSAEGQEVFNDWGYIASESEARTFAPDATIGGEYKLPEKYRP